MSLKPSVLIRMWIEFFNSKKEFFPLTNRDYKIYLHNIKERLMFSSQVESLKRCDVVYISADVATDHEGQSDLSGIQKLIETVIPHLSSTATLVHSLSGSSGIYAKSSIFERTSLLSG